ncbi:hypothetical protein L596_016008 [Steinernema carpocapsae]|nr:hypothetical protein L596_016008 [Steinernema carpocapsae]
MSGTAISPGVVRDTAVNATWALDKKLHCRSFNSSELIDCFRKQLKDEILDVVKAEYDDYDEFVPIVDGTGGVVPEAPEILATYRRKIPIMLGTTHDESSLRLVLLDEKKLNHSNLEVPMAEHLAENLTRTFSGFINHPLISEGCKHEYIWTKIDPSLESEILYNSILKMFSHFWYDAPTSRLATYYAKQKVPVFLYSFDHVSENFETDTV